MTVETVQSMLTLVSHFNKVMHPVLVYFKSPMSYTMRTFNLLAQWDGIPTDVQGCVHFPLARFSLRN
jgi:hypothetical protein